jgi:hypothetical protein
VRSSRNGTIAVKRARIAAISIMRHPTPARLRAASHQAESILAYLPLRICPCVFAAGWMLSWRFGYFVPGPNPAVSLFNEHIEIADEFAVRMNRYNPLKLLILVTRMTQ